MASSIAPKPGFKAPGIKVPVLKSGTRRLALEPLIVEVELDVFLGRPNPRWLLSRASAEQLLAQLPSEPIPTPRPALGYRGFVVRINSGGIKRVVEVHHYAALERWLLESGRFRLGADLIALVEDRFR
jgi:hypothetical protein